MLAGRYRLLERLASGGMAAVWLAEDERLARRVAVKRVHAATPEDGARRLEREAKLLASLSHPNLVAIFDAVADEEGLLLIIEYVPGESLGAALRRGPLPEGRALHVVGAVAAALDHAHAHGVVHRDVKPANVLLGPEGVVKLADLGIATAAERTRITGTGTVLGTPSYMAPEQLSGDEVGAAADVYALAAVAFEALSGRRARSGGTPLEIAHRVATEPPPDMREAWPDAPPAVAEALRRGMARDPSRRPPSASALARELAAALERTATAATASLGVAEAAGAGGATRGAAPAGAPGRRAPAGAPVHRTAPAPTPSRARRRLPWLALAVPLAAAAVAVPLAADGGGGSPGSGGSPTGLPSEAPPGESREPPREESGGGAPEDGAPAQPPAGEPPTPERGASVAEGVRLNDEGYALMQQGRHEAAMPKLRAAVDALAGSGRIEYAYALYNLGRSLRIAGRPEEAVPLLERRLEIPNQRGTVRRELELAREQSSGR